MAKSKTGNINKTHAKSPLRQKTQRLALEQRIVFDAALPIAGADFVDDAATKQQPVTEATITEINPVATESKEAFKLFDTDSQDNTEQTRDLIDGTLAPTGLSSNEIIFIDAIVSDLEQYITNHPNADVVLIDSNADALSQIAAVLDGRTGIDAVHIISHGNAGELSIGNGVLDINHLNTGSHADSLATIQSALTEDADLLIYGCNVADGESGQAFIRALAQATGADVAASTNTTGAAPLGGDWTLEASTADIEATAVDASQWQGVLADPTIDLDSTDPSVAITVTNAADDFAALNLTGGTGWSNNWTFQDIGGGGNSSDVSVTNFNGKNALSIKDDGVSIFRTLDLSSVTDPTLTFDYFRVGIDRGAEIYLEISDNGGTSYTTVNTFTGNDSAYQPFSIDLTPYKSANTTIRFSTNDRTGNFDYLYFSDVKVTSPGTEVPLNHSTEYILTDAPVSISSANTAITSDSGNINSATITLTNPEAGDALSLISGMPTGITASINGNNDTVTLTGAALATDYETAIERIGFSTTGSNTTDRSIDVTVNDGANSNTANTAISIVVDTDGDGISDAQDTDSDNDGISDVDEGKFFLAAADLDVVSPIPAGTYAGDPDGIRLSDATGQFFLDIYLGANTSSSEAGNVKFNQGTGEIGGTNTNGSVSNSEVVELVYTTENSPIAFDFQSLTINNIKSLDGPTNAGGVRDAFVWGEAGTWTPQGTPAGAVVTVDPTKADRVGTFKIKDPDGNSETSDIGDIGSFNQVYQVDNTLSDVLLNMKGTLDGHTVKFEFEEAQQKASLYVFNSGGANAYWAFLPQLTVSLDRAFGPDTDGDGVADYLDLDSDNDGISDLIESGQDQATVDTNNDGMHDSVADKTAAITGDTDNDGLADVADGDNGGTAVTPSSSDSDSIADYLDLDSDNDGIADAVEARPTAGYSSSTHVNNLTNNGVNDDGLYIPVNSDTDNLADYLDTDSDDDGILDNIESGLPTGTDANGDGISDNVGASYADPDGNVNNPQTDLNNELGDTTEVAYRELLDTDGDGIADSNDLDDDNDGILDTVEGEDDVVAIKNTTNSLTQAFTVAGVSNSVTLSTVGGSPSAATGNEAWRYREGVGGAEVGDTYTFTFDKAVKEVELFFDGVIRFGSVGNFTVVYDDNTSASNLDFEIAGNTYGLIQTAGTQAIKGTSSSSGFYGLEDPTPEDGAQNNAQQLFGTLSFLGLDDSKRIKSITFTNLAVYDQGNVSALVVPIVIDIFDQDQDGIANRLDLDSDNDGISDLEESGSVAGLAADANNDGTVSLAENGDTNKDGLMNVFGAGTTPRQTDTDNIADYLDLDSDGDGIADTIEARPTAGYVANDGDVTNNDADGDGVIDLFDNNDGTTQVFGGSFVTPVNTDSGLTNSDTTPDYLDTDSDGDGKLDSAESGLSTNTTDANGDGIRDSVGASYADPDGSVNTPTTNLSNEVGDTTEVGYRELNTPPVATPDTLSGNENTNIAVNLTGTDADGDNTITDITVTALPPASEGILYLADGITAVTLNTAISAAQAATLVFKPATNFTGTVTTIQFTVTDVNDAISPTANVVITVNDLNDAPAGADKTITVLEDTPHTFTAADFGFTDPIDTPANAFDQLTITTLTSTGTLKLSGANVTVGQTITVADIANLTWEPALNSNGDSVANFTFQVIDDGGTNNGGVNTDQSPNTITFNVTSVNDEPLGADKTITIDEDATYTITAADFGFTDTNDNPANNFSNIIITSIPAATDGVYMLSGTAVAANDVITVADITAGNLTFVAAANKNGAGLGDLGFKVQDDGGTDNSGVDTDQVANTLNFNITAVDDVISFTGLNDGPTGTDTGSGLADSQVLESDLDANGSNATGTAEITTGSFTLGSTDALVSFTIGTSGTITKTQLIASATTPINITGANGTLTINGFDEATGVVSYRYTLTSTADHTGNVVINDAFLITTTDVENETATGTLSINIADDAPVAVADTDEAINISGNPSSTADGNVITGTGGSDPNSGDGNADRLGANSNASPVTGVVSGTGAPTTGVGVATNITSANDYGVLKLDADGTYLYTPNYANATVAALTPGQTVTDTYTYEITDGDGDTTTTTLTLTIVGVPAVVGLSDGSVAGTDGNVLESDLSAGTNAAGTGEALNGSFQIVSPTFLLNELRIGGATLTAAQVNALNATPQTIPVGTYGTLVLNGFDAGTGVVSYSYTLTSAPSTAAAISDDFVVAIQDTALNVTPDKFLKINIIDDAPIANPDVNTITEGAATVTGNVITTAADAIGADGTSTTPTGPVTAVVAGTTAPVGNTGIANGVVGTYGTLTLQADGSYSYALNNNNATVNALAPGESLTEVYTYQITDGDGDIATTTLSITINGSNDAPVATPVTTSTPEDTPVTFTLGGTDVDNGDSVATVSITTLPTQGTLYLADGTTPVVAGQDYPAGSFVFVPAPNVNGPVDDIPFTVKDSTGQVSDSPATISLSIGDVNDPPEATPIAISGAEDTPIAVSLAGTDSIDGSVATVTVTALPSATQGILYLADGVTPVAENAPLTPTEAAGLVFKPAPNFNGAVDPISFTVTDDDGAVSAPSDANITVTDVNDPPLATPVTASTPEDTPVTFTLGGTDVDNGDSVATVSITTLPTQGTLYLADGITPVVAGQDYPAGSFVFVPAPNVNGPVDDIPFTVKDSTGQVSDSPATISLSIGDVNDPPEATPIAISGAEDTPITVNLAGTDIDGTIATVNVTALPPASQGILYLADGVTPVAENAALTPAEAAGLVFKPAPNFNGTVDPISFTVTDNDGTVSAPSTANITVTDVNDPPLATPIAISATEDTPVEVSLAGTDDDGTIAAVTVTALPPATQGVLYLADGVTPVAANTPLTLAEAAGLTFVPAANFNGAVAPISFTVTDDDGAVSAPSNANITVSDVNDPPLATPIAASGAEDTPITLTLTGSDVDGTVDTVTITALPPSIQGVLYLADGVTPVAANTPLTPAEAAGLVFKPAPNFNGTVDPISFTVTDDDGTVSAPSTANITVTDVNDPPLATPITTSGAEDTPIGVSLAGTDSIDGSVATVTVTALPSATQGILYLADGVTPVAENAPLTPTEAAGLVFKPAPNFNGAVDPISFTVTDDDGAVSAPSDATITVTDVNDPPVATSVSVDSLEDEDVTVNLVGTDIDGNIASVTIQSLPDPAEGILYLADGITEVTLGQVFLDPLDAAGLIFKPTLDYNSTSGDLVQIDFTVTDDDGGTSAPGSFVIDVANVNDSPVATPVSTSTPEDTPVTFTLDGTDVDTGDDVASVSVTTLPPANQGILYLADGTTPVVAGVDYPPGDFVFAPAPNFNGTVDAIPFTVKDTVGQVSSPPSTISLTIDDVNDAPLATPLAVSGAEDTPITLNLTGTDVDGNIATVTVTALPPASQGVLTLADGTPVAANAPLTPAQAAGLVFKPAPNYNGPVDAISFTVTDDDGLVSAPSNANITVTDVNDVPVATSVSVNTLEDADVPVNLTGTDIDGLISTVTVTTLPTAAEGILYLADGTTPVTINTPLTPAQAAGLVFKPTLNYNSTSGDLVQIDFTVTDDDSGTSAPGSFVIDVANVNDSPVATPVSTSTPEDTPVTFILDGTDVDTGDDVASVSVTTLPSAEQGILYLADGITPVVAGVDYPPGSFTFVPAPNFNGTVDAIPFTVKDTVGQISSPPSTISLTIDDVNDAPLATPLTTSGAEDTPITLNLTGTDVDGNIATVTVTALPPATQGVLTLADGTPVAANAPLTPTQAAGLIFKPAPNYNGPVDAISFTVTDDDGAISAPSDAKITVTDVNDPPVATSVSVDIDEDTEATVNLTGTDIDGDISTVTVTTLPTAAEGILYLADGTTPVTINTPLTPAQAAGLRFIPTPNYNSISGDLVQIDFTVTDNDGGTSAPGSFVIDVAHVNDSPVATPVSTSTPEDTPVTFTLDGTDVDTGDDVASVSVTTLPSAEQGILYLADGTTPVVAGVDYPPGDFVFAPAPNFNGTVDAIPFTVKDTVGQVSSPPSTISLTIDDVNDAPLATASSPTGDEDTPIAVNLTGTDIDGDIATITVTDMPLDNQGVLTLADGTPVTLGSPLTPEQAAGLIFTPALNFNGPVDPISFTVTDDDGETSVPSDVNITVADVNDAPVPTPVAPNGDEDTPIAVSLAGTDVDGTVVAITVTTLPPASQGVLYLADGVTPVSANSRLTPLEAADLIFKPALNFNGQVNPIGFTVTDDRGLTSAPSDINITVNSVNDPPVAAPVSVAGSSETGIPLSVGGSDIDGTIAAVTITTLPPASQGVLLLPNGTPVVAGQALTPAQAANLVFKPNQNFDGNVSIQFTVTDNEGLVSAPSSISIDVELADTIDVELANNGLFEQLIAQKPIQFAPSVDTFNQFQNDIPSLGLNLPEALYIMYAIRESSNQVGANSAFGVFNADAATLNEIQGFIAGLKNSSNGTDKHLFVQFAVRHQSFATDPSIFIQNVVRQSFVESIIRGIGITSSMNSASMGFSTLFSAFELGSPSGLIELLEDLYKTLTDSADSTQSVESENTEENTTADNVATLAQDTDVLMTSPAKTVSIVSDGAAPERNHIAAAPSFANQLQIAANKFKYTEIKDQIN